MSCLSLSLTKQLSFSKKSWFCVCHHQSIVCISSYIHSWRLLYCQREIYARFETNNEWSKKNHIVNVISQYWIKTLIDFFLSICDFICKLISNYQFSIIFIAIWLIWFNHLSLLQKLGFWWTTNKRLFLKNLFTTLLIHSFSHSQKITKREHNSSRRWTNDI